MTPTSASQAARELVKAYIEHQTIHVHNIDAKSTGDSMADMLIAMHQKLSAYFQKGD